jgi:hypothetical protein
MENRVYNTLVSSDFDYIDQPDLLIDYERVSGYSKLTNEIQQVIAS